MPKTTLLKVVPNPFCAELDHEGRCHGRLRYEPDKVELRNGASAPRWVGCRVLATKIRDADPHSRLGELYDHAWEYDLEPCVVPATAYYLSAMREHGHHGPALFAADVDTHALVFGARSGFIEPRVRLAQLAEERKAAPQIKSTHADAGKPRDHEAEWAAYIAGPAPVHAPHGQEHEETP